MNGILEPRRAAAPTAAAAVASSLASALARQPDDDALRRDVQALLDIEAIKRLKHAYFRGLDSANLELLATLFHPEVQVHFVGGDYEWRLDGREQYVETIAANFHANVVAQHTGNHPEITLLSATEAEGIWYLHDDFYDMAKMLFTTGSAFYHDRYEKVDGRWLIRSTRYERHYELVTPMKQVPNFTVRYLARHGRAAPQA
jgi:hypothetical protein